MVLDVEHGLGARGERFQAAFGQDFPGALANFFPKFADRRARFSRRIRKLRKRLGFQSFHNREECDFGRSLG